LAEFSYLILNCRLVDLHLIEIPSSMMRNYILKPNLTPSSGNQLLKNIYLQYKGECTYWLMQKFGLGKEDAIDVFQNTVIILHDKIENHKLDLPAEKLKSYLFGIARNKGLEYLRSLDKYVTTNYAEQILKDSTTIREKELIEKKIEAISEGISLLSKSSQDIIMLYYEQHKSISEITEILGYKNNETTKNMKYKSVQKLKRIVNKNLKGASIEHSENILYAL